MRLKLPLLPVESSVPETELYYLDFVRERERERERGTSSVTVTVTKDHK
jgi:hypothetical protein